MRSSCMDCSIREPGCHSRCTAYLEFKKKVEEINENRRKDMDNGRTHYTSMENRRTLVKKTQGERNRGRINVND